MSLSAQQKAIRLKEQRIGRKAAKAVEAYVKTKLRTTLNIRNKGGVDEYGRKIPPILEATKVKAKTGQYYLLGLNLTSNKYGFIQHFGVAGTRAKHIVLLKNNTSFIRPSHPFNLKEKKLFDNIYEKSGALNILADGLAETRTKVVKAIIQDTVVTLNNQNG